MKIKNPVIMKEIELTEKERGELEVAVLIIDALYNILYNEKVEELITEMDGVNTGNISKKELSSIGKLLERILYADILCIKSEEE